MDVLDFIVVRTPLLSLSESMDRLWSARSRRQVRANLLKIISYPEVKEALWISNPGLAEDLFNERTLGRGLLKMESRGRMDLLYRCVLRLGTRPVPFGTSAGISLGKVLEKPDCFRLSARKKWRKAARPDEALIYHAWSNALRTPQAWRRVKWKANPTIIRHSGNIQYSEEETLPSLEIKTKMARVELTPWLERILEAAVDWTSIDVLEAALEKRWNGKKKPEKKFCGEYLENLIAAQILIPDLIPAVTGRSNFERLASKLRYVAPGSGAGDLLSVAVRAARTTSKNAPGKSLEIYRHLHAETDRLTRQMNLKLPRHRIHVDLHKPSPGLSLGASWGAHIKAAIQALGAMNDGMFNQNQMLKFAAVFSERNGMATVNLSEVFDPQIGLKWPANDRECHSGPCNSVFRRLEAHVVSHENDDAKIKKDTWILNLGKFVSNDLGMEPRWPASTYFSVGGSMIEKDSFHLKWVNNGGGMKLLGRFLNADPALKRKVIRSLREEEALNPSAIFAEIVFCEDQRAGFYNSRPVTRKYEIVLSPRSGVPPDRQIMISDLTVCVRENRFILRCPKLGNKVVIPRHLTARNFETLDIPVAKFLAGLRESDCPVDLMWSWHHLEGRARLPRIVFGRTILALQEWNVVRHELPRLSKASFRRALGIPRLVKICEGDREFPVDLGNPVSVANAVKLANSEKVKLQEWLFSSQTPVRGPEGAYANEFIIPCRKQRDRILPEPGTGAPEIRRRYKFRGPGTDWVYLKLSLNPEAADSFLVTRLLPLVRQMDSWEKHGKFFFVRYADPEPHLRIRFQFVRGDERAEWTRRLLDWSQELLETGQIWNCSFDTYVREVERYGGPEAMELAESLFTADSLGALEWLNIESGERDLVGLPAPLSAWANVERLIFALWSVDSTLRLAGFDLKERLRWAGTCSSMEETKAGREVRKLLSSIFRERFQSGIWELSSDLAPEMGRIIEKREQAQAADYEKWLWLRKKGKFFTHGDDFLLSVCHMQLNRLRILNMDHENTSIEAALFRFLNLLFTKKLHLNRFNPKVRT